MGTVVFNPVKRLAKAKINFVVTKFSEIRGILLQYVPGSSVFRHFEYREDPGDEIGQKS